MAADVDLLPDDLECLAGSLGSPRPELTDAAARLAAPRGRGAVGVCGDDTRSFRDLVVRQARPRPAQPPKWALAMRACTPTVLSTTWETTKSAAAER